MLDPKRCRTCWLNSSLTRANLAIRYSKAGKKLKTVILTQLSFSQINGNWQGLAAKMRGRNFCESFARVLAIVFRQGLTRWCWAVPTFRCWRRNHLTEESRSVTVKVLPGSHLVIMLGLRQWRFINGQLLLLVDPVLWRSISTPMDNRSFDLLRHVYGTGYIRLDLKGLVVANGAVETGNGDFPKQAGLVVVYHPILHPDCCGWHFWPTQLF